MAASRPLFQLTVGWHGGLGLYSYLVFFSISLRGALPSNQIESLRFYLSHRPDTADMVLRISRCMISVAQARSKGFLTEKQGDNSESVLSPDPTAG